MTSWIVMIADTAILRDIRSGLLRRFRSGLCRLFSHAPFFRCRKVVASVEPFFLWLFQRWGLFCSSVKVSWLSLPFLKKRWMSVRGLETNSLFFCWVERNSSGSFRSVVSSDNAVRNLIAEKRPARVRPRSRVLENKLVPMMKAQRRQLVVYCVLYSSEDSLL